MSKRTTILILTLAILTAGLLYLALIGTAPKKIVVLPPTPTPMSPNAKTTLSLEAAPASLSSALSAHTVAVVINTANLVNGVQIELGYDPNTITNVSVSPGPFFQQPSALIKNIDTTDGRISYALVEQLDVKGHAGQGIVALVSFDTKPEAAGATTLVFMPKTAVTSQGILESVLKKTTNYTLTLTTPTPGKSASGSAR